MVNQYLIIIIGLLFSTYVSADIKQQEISYQQGNTQLKGFLAYDDSYRTKRPAVLIVHEWWGQNDYARKRAVMLAKLGYVAFAVDMYGDGKTTTHPKTAGAFSSLISGNLSLAKARFEAGIETLKKQPMVEQAKIAALGYCFGGGILLQLARMGLDIDGVVSFHGSIATNSPAHKGDIKTKIRVFNGADDPFVKPEQITAFKQEMKTAGVDYKFVNYPNAKHSFTNADSTAIGKQYSLPLAYNKAADVDSWQQTQTFLNNIFNK